VGIVFVALKALLDRALFATNCWIAAVLTQGFNSLRRDLPPRLLSVKRNYQKNASLISELRI
jgi:hypothetical protein